MGEKGMTITRYCYYGVDIVCSCYSIRFTWQSYFKARTTFIPKYGAEARYYTKSGVTALKMKSEMRFIGTVMGIGAQTGSVLLDFYSIFLDTYNLMDEYIDDDAPIFINPDVGYGRK